MKTLSVRYIDLWLSFHLILHLINKYTLIYIYAFHLTLSYIYYFSYICIYLCIVFRMKSRCLAR